MATGDVLTIPVSGNAEFRPGVQVVRVPVTFADFVDVAGVGLALTDYVIPEGSILMAHSGVVVTTPFNDSGTIGGQIDFVAGTDADPANSIADTNADGSGSAGATDLNVLTLMSMTNVEYLDAAFAAAATPVSFVLPVFADDGTAGEAEGILFLIAPVAP